MIDPDFSTYYITAMKGWRLPMVNWTAVAMLAG